MPREARGTPPVLMNDLVDRIGASLEGLGRRLRGKPRHAQQVALPKLRLGRGEYYARYAVAPDLLHQGAVIYSFGIGEHVEFELELVGRFGCKVLLFDPEPLAVGRLRAQQLPPQVLVHSLGLSDRDGVASSGQARSSGYASEQQLRRLTTLMDQFGHGHIDLLKMDIEGAEYAVIDALSASGVRPTQILVEFHHHLRHLSLSHTERALTQLNRLGYRIFDCQAGGHEFSLVLV